MDIFKVKEARLNAGKMPGSKAAEIAHQQFSVAISRKKEYTKKNLTTKIHFIYNKFTMITFARNFVI